jgi:uncharacterized protein (TIGR02453 family)
MIQKSTLDFLKKIKTNNNRVWFEKNKSLYLAAKEDAEKNLDEIISGIRSFDKRITTELTGKKCMFRIYRDTRFAKDKRPYKNNMGASINPGGKNAIVPGYYIHIEPGKTFVAGGIWMPPAPELGKIRQEVDYNQKEFLKIINDKNFKKLFGELDADDKLVNVPKGFSKDHPMVEILKLKSFLVVGTIKEKDVLNKNFVKEAVSMCKAMLPLNNFIQRALD